MRTLLIVLEHRDRHVFIPFRFHECEEGVFCAICVPKREHRIVRESFRLVKFMVESTIEPVHIHIYGRVDHGVVEGCVEHLLLGLAALNADTAKLLLPFCLGCRADIFETPAGSLGLEVPQGSRCAGCRQGNFYGDGSRHFSEAEPCNQFPAGHLREIVVLGELGIASLIAYGRLVFVAVFHHWLRETDGEVGVVGSGPAVGNAVASDEGVIVNPDFGPESLAVVVVDAVVEIQDQVRILCSFGPGVTVHSCACGGGEFCLDAAVGEGNAVVSGRSAFAVMAESGPVPAVGVGCRAGGQLNFSGARHQQYVAKVGMSGAAEMCVAESHDGGVVVLVACTIVIGAWLVFPIDIVRNGVGIGGELHTSEGNAGPGEAVSHARGADKWIDVSGVLCYNRTGCEQDAGQCGHRFIHVSNIRKNKNYSYLYRL